MTELEQKRRRLNNLIARLYVSTPTITTLDFRAVAVELAEAYLVEVDRVEESYSDGMGEEREACALLLEEIAAAEASIADAESTGGDEQHEAIRRQNSWAFKRAAQAVRERSYDPASLVPKLVAMLEAANIKAQVAIGGCELFVYVQTRSDEKRAAEMFKGDVCGVRVSVIYAKAIPGAGNE